MIKYINTGKKATAGDCVALADSDEIPMENIFRLLSSRKDGADILRINDPNGRISIPDKTKLIYLGDSLLIRALSISPNENCYGKSYYKNIPFPPAVNDTVLCAVTCSLSDTATKFRKGTIVDISDSREEVEVSFGDVDTFLVDSSDCIRI